METKIIKIKNRKSVTDQELSEAAEIIKNGGLVAFPTETVYGLGADALNKDASIKIYAAKGRPSDNPLIAHISELSELDLLTEDVKETVYLLAEKFWPGPLTMVMKKSSIVPYTTTGGLDTVAVRMPSDPIARKLIKLSGVPIAAPSANTSGRPSPTLASHVIKDMDGKINMIIDAGPVGIGVESTIVDMTGDVVTILRPGAVTKEMLEAVVGNVLEDQTLRGPISGDIKPKAPGMKYRHYAPKATLVLVEGPVDMVAKMINIKVEEAVNNNQSVGIIATDESMNRYPIGVVKSIGKRSEEKTIAHNLYAILREFDDLDVEIIYSESFTSDNLGEAIMNRLMKAAGYHTIRVI